MEIKSILIKDTTKEERIRIIQEGLSQFRRRFSRFLL